MKRTRRDRGEMEEIMFKLFERQPNWSLRQLLYETDQPEVCFWTRYLLFKYFTWRISLNDMPIRIMRERNDKIMRQNKSC